MCPPFHGVRRLAAAFALSFVLLSGCEAVQLENRTVRQSGTLSELQYKQVVNNLAAIADDLAGASPLHDGSHHDPGEPATGVHRLLLDLQTVGSLFNQILFDKGCVLLPPAKH